MGLWAAFPLTAAGKGISSERLTFTVKRIDWAQEIQRGFRLLYARSETSKTALPECRIWGTKASVRDFMCQKFPSTTYASLIQAPHTRQLWHFPKSIIWMYTGVFNLIILFYLIILLVHAPQSNCLSSDSSCLSLGLDKVPGFRFLIKASCSPEVMEESWAQWPAFCHSLSWDTQILQPGILWVSGRHTASFLWELLLSVCLLLSEPGQG